MLEVTDEEFDRLVSEALDTIPPGLATMVDNCVILVEDEAPEDAPDLLGLYEGTPLPERGEWYAGVLPDTVRIFRVTFSPRSIPAIESRSDTCRSPTSRFDEEAKTATVFVICR